MKKYSTALVIGGGAFGTSIAYVLAQNFNSVVIKVRNKSSYDELKSHQNKRYLPNKTLPENIVPALSWEQVDESSQGELEVIVSGLPTAGLVPFFEENSSPIIYQLMKKVPFISLTKGIDPKSLHLPDEIMEDYIGMFKDQVYYLSGPSFAAEILDKQITLVSLAGRNREELLKVCDMLHTPFFKAVPTYDIKGVLLGGALKNILAIAGGIIEGLGYNHNTRAAMIYRGIVEMLRFGVVFNARPETFYGLSGMGDLILTTTGDLSRNKSFGKELAKGHSAEEILAKSTSVVEGYKTTQAAYLLAKKYAIRAPLFTGLYEVLYKGKKPEEVLVDMMDEPSKFDSFL